MLESGADFLILVFAPITVMRVINCGTFIQEIKEEQMSVISVIRHNLTRQLSSEAYLINYSTLNYDGFLELLIKKIKIQDFENKLIILYFKKKKLYI